MRLRKQGHNLYLELRSTDALFLISELAKAADLSQVTNFPKLFPVNVTYSEDGDEHQYAHVLHVRVEPPRHE